MNKIEEIKKERDGLDMEAALFRYADLGWKAITDDDKERLKWWGIFFRKPTPGLFMIRIRIPNGMTNAEQLRTIAQISMFFGKGFAVNDCGHSSALVALFPKGVNCNLLKLFIKI